MTAPDRRALGQLTAEALPLVLYALEVCAVQLTEAGRADDAAVYRDLARTLADTAGQGG